MPGLFSSKKQSKEAKRRYEHLMLLAKENPNKIFDLSECELYSVPSSLFVQCRVFLTESLILHSNFFKSLKGGGKMADLSNLRVLDLHSNKMTHLPEDIGCLQKLQVLNVENNQLTELPPAIGGLSKLQSLLAKDNFLNCIPQTIKTMTSLRTLDVSGSNQVFYLPKNLCHVQTLEVLLLSKPHCMEYPPAMVATQGLEAIQKYICKDCGVKYIPPSHAVLHVLDQVDGQSSSTRSQIIDTQTATSIEIYEKQKEEKKRLHLEMERQLAEDQTQLAMLSSKDKKARQKDYLSLKKDAEDLEKTIHEQQEKKEKEKKELFNRLKQVEIDASNLVAKLLNATEKARQNEALLEKMEEQRLKEEHYFRVTQEDIDKLRKQETLAAMQLMLESDNQSRRVVERYLAEQDESRVLAQQSTEEVNEKLEAHLVQQQNYQDELLRKVITEEEIQKEAFAVLQFQHDAVQMRLMSQIDELQEELVRLTFMETKKKNMKMEIEQESLRLIRTELTDMLVQLLKEKDQREEVLHQRLLDMEQERENDQIDFWLVQYQRLLDSKPEILVQKEHGLEDDVINLLRRADASHHIPSFARHKVTSENVVTLTERQLQSIGVFEIGIRANIMREMENLVAQRKKVDSFSPSTTPSIRPSKSVPAPIIPPISEPSPSIPSAPNDPNVSIDNECVICMDRESDCVLLPCGHVCSCFQCASTLTTCPMCRSKISQKVRMFRS